MGQHLALQRFDRQRIESNIRSRMVQGDADLSHEDHKIGLQGWHRPGKWDPEAQSWGGESLGYAEQTTCRTLHSPRVPQTDTIARRWQREGSREGHDMRVK